MVVLCTGGEANSEMLAISGAREGSGALLLFKLLNFSAVVWKSVRRFVK